MFRNLQKLMVWKKHIYSCTNFVRLWKDLCIIWKMKSPLRNSVELVTFPLKLTMLVCLCSCLGQLWRLILKTGAESIMRMSNTEHVPALTEVFWYCCSLTVEIPSRGLWPLCISAVRLHMKHVCGCGKLSCFYSVPQGNTFLLWGLFLCFFFCFFKHYKKITGRTTVLPYKILYSIPKSSTFFL